MLGSGILQLATWHSRDPIHMPWRSPAEGLIGCVTLLPHLTPFRMSDYFPNKEKHVGHDND